MKDPKPILRVLARRAAGQWTRSWPKWFVLSAGAILVLVGANRVLDGLGKAQVLDLPDPVFGAPFRYVLLGLGMAEVFASWLCLFTKKRDLSLGLVVWLSFDVAVYRIGLWTMGWPHPWVFVGGVAGFLGISPVLADSMLLGASMYLVVGGTVLLLPQKKLDVRPEQTDYFKAACAKCGGKTGFTTRWLGQTVACPHCGAPLALPAAACK